MLSPKVSIVIPAYNQGNYLPEALESVIDQTFTEWECIVVNDGSTDGTAEVIRDYTARDTRIRSISQSNMGLPAARNAGLAGAEGEFLQFLDADDIILPTKLSIQVERLQKINGPAITYTDYYYAQAGNIRASSSRRPLSANLSSAELLHDLILNWESTLSIPVHCFLFKTDLFHQNGIRFDTNLPNHEDWDCWVQIFRKGPQVDYVPEKLAAYRLHESSITRDVAAMQLGFVRAIEKQLSLFSPSSPEFRLLQHKKNKVLKQYRIFIFQKRVLSWIPLSLRLRIQKRLS